MDIEDRIFELLGERLMPDDLLDRVVEEYGVQRSVARELTRRVIRERGTPNLAIARRHIERLRHLRV
jgi:hypothetical protein